MMSWVYIYFNNILFNKEKDIEILRLTAKIQRLEGILDSIQYIIKDKKQEVETDYI